MRSRYLRPDEDVLNTESEAMQLQEGSEEATQSREKLVGHAPTIQLLTGVDEAKLGGPKLRLVQHSTEQLARTEHHLQQAQSTSQHVPTTLSRQHLRLCHDDIPGCLAPPLATPPLLWVDFGF